MNVAESTSYTNSLSARESLFTPDVPKDTVESVVRKVLPEHHVASLTLSEAGLHITMDHVATSSATSESLTRAAHAIALQTHLPVAIAAAARHEMLVAEEAASNEEMHTTTSEILVAVNPTLPTIVLREPFTDIYRDVPPSMLADLYAEHMTRTALMPSEEQFQPPMREIRKVLSQWLEVKDFKIIDQRTFLQIVMYGDSALTVEPDFHSLCSLIVAANRQKYPLLITVAPESSIQSSLEGGSKSESSQGAVTSAHEDISSEEVSVQLDTVNPLVPPTPETLTPLSHTVRSALKLKPDSRWLHVHVVSDGLLLDAQCPLPRRTIDAIRNKLCMIPAPIVLRIPAEAKDSLSVADLKSIVKLTLTPTATLIRGDAKDTGKFQQVTMRLIASPVEGPALASELQTLTKGFKSVGQEINFKIEEYSPELAARLGVFHPRSLRTIFQQSRGTGSIIPVTSFDYTEHPLRLADSRGLLLHRYKHNHGARVYTEAPVFMLDGQKTGSLHEDAFSVEQTKDKITVAIHAVNGAFIVSPTSYERLCAYNNGTTVYSAGSYTATMLPGLRKWGFRANIPCPAISMFITVNAHELEHTDSYQAIDLSDIRVELTEVKPAASEHYVEGADLGAYTGAFRSEVTTIRKLARAIRNYQSNYPEPPGYEAPLGRDIQSLLSFFSKNIVDLVAGTVDPLIYTYTERPSPSALEEAIGRLRNNLAVSHPLYELCKHGARSICASDELLSLFYSYAWSLSTQQRRRVFIPHSESKISMQADYVHYTSGYRSYTPANKALRDLPSLIAQHQLNARFGMYPALSYQQVEACYQRAVENAAHADRLRRDLTLFYDVSQLKLHANTGLTGHIITPKGHSNPTVSIGLLADQGRKIHLVEGINKLKNVARQRASKKPVTLWPTHYDVEKDTLYVTLKRPKN